MTKERNTRLKIYLVKPENVNSDELIKEETSRRKFNTKAINSDTLYYKESHISVPSWYKEFLGQTDEKVYSAGISAFFFHTVQINEQNVKFAIVFGGGESGLNLEMFDDSFGLRIALNLAEEFLNIRKDNISTTLSKTREQAVKGQSVSSFGIDFEKDMLNGVTVKPKDNDISIGNITGAMSVSIAKPLKFTDLDDLLKKCYQISEQKDYLKNYPFIGKIKEIKQDKTLISKINDEILRLFNERDDSRVWICVPDIIEWTEYVDYTYSWGRSTVAKKETLPEITINHAHHFIDNSDGEIKFEKFSDFKKAKIKPNKVDGQEFDPWTFEDCLYAHIELDGHQYVLSNKKYYQIDRDYVEDVDKRFNALTTVNPLPNYSQTAKESGYIQEVCNQNANDYVVMDQKLVTIQTKIEICDIFDKSQKRFIHIKKYGSSAVLSHLFSQAFVSADLFADSNSRKIMLKRMLQENSAVEQDEQKSNYSVVIAIITREQIVQGQHANLPFFSKLNLVSTVEKIQKLGYKSVDVMYIKATAPLYQQNG